MSLKPLTGALRQRGFLGCITLLVVGLPLTWGCGTEGAKPKAESAGHSEHEHAHSDEGPHHGQLIELGKEEYHAEMLHDDLAHKITIYLLDGSAKKSVAIAEKELTLNIVADGKPQQFKLPAMPLSEDSAGQSSRFELTDQTLCEALDDPKTTGRLNITIAGKPYAGEVSHDHEHEHKH